jgi:hypothetical protein
MTAGAEKGRALRARRILPLVLSLIAMLTAGVVYDVWMGRRSLPSPLQYIPATSEAYAISGPISQLLEHGATIPFSRFASHAGLYAPLTRRLEERCLDHATAADWNRYGIDIHRGLALAILDQERSRFSLVVPTTNEHEFESFFRTVATKIGRVSFRPRQEKTGLKTIRIVANNSEGVRFCSSISGQVPLEVGHKLAPGETIFAVPDPAVARATVGMKCIADYSDGSSGPCGCLLDYSKPCDDPQVLPASVFERGRALTVRSPDGIAAIRSMDGGNALVVIGDGAAELENLNLSVKQQGNLTAHAADDMLRTVLRTLVSGSPEGGMTLFGAVSAPIPPLFGRLHFWMNVTPRAAYVRVLVPWQTLQSSLLAAMLRDTPPQKEGRQPLSRWAELRIADPSFGTYLEYARVFHNSMLESVYKPLGSMSVVLRELASLESIGEIRIGLIGIRDGVPELAVSFGVPRSKAAEIVLKQRKALRTARDVEVLNGALALSTENEFTDGQSGDDIAWLLTPEPGTSWARYRVRIGKGSDEKVTRMFVATDGPDSEEFDRASYNASVGGRRFAYLSPPFTDNDLKYRLGDIDLATIDQTTLKEDRFRLVSYYDEQSGRLIVATNATALEAVVAGSEALLRLQPESRTTKLSLKLNADWLAAQVRTYPSQDIGEAERDAVIEELERYRKIEVAADALGELNSWLLTMKFTND